MRRNTTGGLLALALCAVYGVMPLAGQQARQGVTVTHSARGWLGIRFDLEVRRISDSDEPQLTMRIHEVQEGGPADDAGVQPGDTVLRIDGEPVSPATLETLFGDLDPGEPVRLTLRRNGSSREASVVAGRRPVHVSVAPTVSVRLDSMTHAIVARMDSTRISLERGGVAVVRGPGSSQWVRVHGDSLHFFPEGRVIMPRVGGVAGAMETVPLEVFLFDSQEASAARREIVRVERELRRIQEDESRRLREMARTRQAIDQNDARLRELREREARLQVEMARALEEIERAREDARQSQVARMRELQERTQRAAVEARRVAEVARADFRPLSLYAAGQNVVAGARVTELNPALAEYFDVRSGVLVTDVVEDTPAAEAALVAGDVIVRVGDVPVQDLGDLRAALVRSDGRASLTVVRKGRRVTVQLPRE